MKIYTSANHVNLQSLYHSIIANKKGALKYLGLEIFSYSVTAIESKLHQRLTLHLLWPAGPKLADLAQASKLRQLMQRREEAWHAASDIVIHWPSLETAYKRLNAECERL